MRQFGLMTAALFCSALAFTIATAWTNEDKDAGKSLPAPLGTRIADFTLVNAQSEKPWSFGQETRDARAIVVLFLGTECPVSNAYAPKVNQLQQKYAKSGVVFLGINSNEQDELSAVAKHARSFELQFPVLKDDGTKIAERFNVQRIPEAFVLDGQRMVRYRGRVDDQFAPVVKRGKPTTSELVDALEAVLAGKEVKTRVTQVAGCLLGHSKEPVKVQPGEQITYSKHIAPIIQNHCQDCHRPGEVGPFKLMSYKDASAWADNIREVVSEGRMPPWHADPHIGKFSNDRRLSESDKQTLISWIDQGCVQGDPKDEPPARHYTTGWGIGQPDEIIRINHEVKVPASTWLGGMAYQYIVAGEQFTEDKWVQAVEARADNRALVHHIIVYITPPRPIGQPLAVPFGNPVERLVGGFFSPPNPARTERRRSPDAIGHGMLAAYAPGDQPIVFPPSMAKKIAKGSQLIFQMHYTPNGKEGVDRSMVGIIYAKEPPEHEVHTRSVDYRKFEIPPGEGNYEVKSTKAFEKPAVIYSLNPHMHLRGKDFKFELVYPDGKRELILSVPKYDFNWQTNYNLSEPIHVAAGTKVECTAHFDNSLQNPFNPNPEATVRWGEQTYEEMMIGFVDYYFEK
jgi:thiol-disulfide isomerase/thioredoxin